MKHPAAPWLVAAALAAVYLIWSPASADLATQLYRTELFEREGFGLWNGNWYSGHHTPGYSVLFPPLASLVGARVVGALAAVAAAGLFAEIARRRFGKDAGGWGALWFAAATATNLFTGRLTFALGVAIALGGILAAQRGRDVPALALAVLTPLASPVAGLFLGLAAAAHALATRQRLSAGLAVGAVAPVVILAVLFPEGGVEPFVASAFWPAAVAAAVAVLVLPGEHRDLRIGAALYGLACIAAFVIDTPMGGNATRLGALMAGPLAACALWPRRRAALALVAVPLLVWQWHPPVRDVRRAHGDRSVEASFYAPLKAFLTRAAGTSPVRIELLPTVNKWEVVHVSSDFPLARGWERQLDIKHNALFYEGPLTARHYQRWLRDNGVRYIALPAARLDYAAEAEARLVRRGVSYLRPVWRNPDWRVWRVIPPGALAVGPGLVTSLESDGFDVRAYRAGPVQVRVRFTPYWTITRGTGCVRRSADGFVRLEPSVLGPLRVRLRFSPLRALQRGPRCSSAEEAP